MMVSSVTLTEFELIARFFSDIGTPDPSLVPLSIGDDCALLSTPEGYDLALSIDTMIAGRHFPESATADDIGYRLLAVAVSDLAAMGATPLAFTLALTLPNAKEGWLSLFSAGLKQAATNFDIALIGGDTTRGPLTLTAQVHGKVARGHALKRDGAQVGDLVFVTGALGDAAAALAMFEQRIDVNDGNIEQYFHQRFYRPTPRLGVARLLATLASAAIDVSDGLLADLGHICASSSLAAIIRSEKIPLSPSLIAAVGDTQGLSLALSGGDDYELCFTAPAAAHDKVMAVAEASDVAIHVIGEIVEGSGVNCVDGSGKTFITDGAGYRHFE